MKKIIIGLLCIVAFATVDAKEFEEEVQVEHKVLFDTAKYEVKSVEELKGLELRNKEVAIIGSTDSRGTAAYNMSLGMRRAQYVSSILGVPASVSSVGENNATGNMKEDRNVMIIVTVLEYNPIFGGYTMIQGPTSHLQYATIPRR